MAPDHYDSYVCADLDLMLFTFVPERLNLNNKRVKLSGGKAYHEFNFKFKISTPSHDVKWEIWNLLCQVFNIYDFGESALTVT